MTANFRFTALYRLLTDLTVLVRTSGHNSEYLERLGVGANRYVAENDPKFIEALEDCVENAKNLATYAETFLGHLKSDHIDDGIKRLRYWAEHPPFEWSELHVRSRVLRDAIEIELRGYYFYQYPKDKGAKLLAWKDDWAAACVAFPDIKVDVYCATDCYALGHGTASVFHSMRVAEHGLRAIARERRLSLPKDKPLEWGTWREIIKELDKEIERIQANEKAGAAKDSAVEFYSGARADLNGFKDEYRNQVSHLRASYDDLQALRALTNVNHFMLRMAAKIDHTHKPIDWGF